MAKDTKQGSKSLFGRFNKSVDEKIDQNRGSGQAATGTKPVSAPKPEPSQDISQRRAPRNAGGSKMVIPEGVTIQGSISGGKEAEISGRVQGDVAVEGTLYLGGSAQVKGNIKAHTAKIEGAVQGKVECTEELELGKNGKLQSETVSAKKVIILGNVQGNVNAPGILQLGPSAQINGDVKTRRIQMEEGAALNGKCVMQPAGAGEGA